MIDLRLGDCLDVMKTIPSASVDAIITDPPYGTTACKWDSVIPFEPMWAELKRIIKFNGAIVLFGSEPFSSALRMSNIKNYKYDWVWDKKIPSGMSYARYQPMRQHECILIFCAGKTIYNAQVTLRDKPIKKGGNKFSETAPIAACKNNVTFKKIYTTKQPTSIIQFDKMRKGSVHPTQKPVALLEYLIKTYTQENETVLDFTMGSGTAGVACKNLNRNFIGIELDEGYYNIAKERINGIG
jgi:DNA modification methylase